MQEMVSDMDDVEQRSWRRQADWMKQRYHAECSAVSALHKLASQAAFAAQPLPFHLDLQVLPHRFLHFLHSQRAHESLPCYAPGFQI